MAMVELASALVDGNVQGFVGVVYLTDGDTLRFGDIRGLAPALVRADVEGMLNDLTE